MVSIQKCLMPITPRFSRKTQQSPHPRFAGNSAFEGQAKQMLFNTLVMRQGVYRDIDLGIRKDPLVGDLPTELTQVFGNEARALDFLNQTAQALQLDSEKPEKTLQKIKTPQAVTLRFVATGDQGNVFLLSAGGKAFAFKVFPPIPRYLALMNGVFAESRALIFFNAQGAKDIAKFQCSNPSQHWMLSEFIDKTKQYNLNERGTTTVADVVKEYKLYQTGDGGKNRINGILVDAGGFATEVEARELRLIQ